MGKIRAKMPGKVIISGEHAVVDGKMAITASLGLGVEVEVGEGVREKELKEDRKGLVEKAIEVAGGKGKVKIKITSQLPVGSGLGSSAAVAAATIKAVREYLGKAIEKEELFELTMEVEKLAHGNPSGVDPATVVYGGLISYIKGQAIERLEIGIPVRILLVNSGRPSESTKEMVEQVANKRNKAEIFEEIGELTKQVRKELSRGGAIGELINKNGLLLEKLGVVGEKAKKLSHELRELGDVVKITGAGGVRAGSGMMIVIPKNLEKTKRLLDNRQVGFWETMIGEP